jgi:hypothetical protein
MIGAILRKIVRSVRERPTSSPIPPALLSVVQHRDRERHGQPAQQRQSDYAQTGSQRRQPLMFSAGALAAMSPPITE